MMFYTAILRNTQTGEVVVLRANASHDRKDAWAMIKSMKQDGCELIALVKGDHPVYSGEE